MATPASTGRNEDFRRLGRGGNKAAILAFCRANARRIEGNFERAVELSSSHKRTRYHSHSDVGTFACIQHAIKCRLALYLFISGHAD